MKRIFLIAAIIFISLGGYSQDNKFSASLILNEATGFNFFVGPSAPNFMTTPKAFGSGVYDFSGQYSIFSFWLLKPEKSNIGLATTVALKISKYRFIENYYFDTQNNILAIDNNPDHYFNPMFFSRHGSKLVTGKLNIPLLLYLPISQWFGDSKGFFGIYGGAYYDGFLFAYHKLYYKDVNGFSKDKYSNSAIKQYFTKNNYGFRGGIKLGNVFITGQYSMLPIFENLPYDIHEAKIGISFRMNFEEKLEEKLEDIDLGTDAK